MAMAKSTGSGTKLVVQNRKARHDYFLDDFHEAGLVLTGTEVKSLRDGRASLKEAWVKVDDHGEAWLMQAHIAEYEYGNRQNHHPTRPRKLLLHRYEIDRLAKETREQGITIVPTKIYFRNGRAKVEVAVGRGKQHFDKRADLKAKQHKREMERALKQRR